MTQTEAIGGEEVHLQLISGDEEKLQPAHIPGCIGLNRGRHNGDQCGCSQV